MQKNETATENRKERHEFEAKNEDMDSPYNIQENKKPQQTNQQFSKESNKAKDSNIHHSTNKKKKIPKDRLRIKTPDFLKVIQRHTNFPAIYVLIPIMSCGLFVWFGSFEIFLTNLIGLVFPIYWTMRAFNEPNHKEEEKQWYTYWLIYLSMIPLDMLFGKFLKHVPLLYFAKYVFLCWMFLPNFKGASYIHDILIKKRFPDFDIVNRIDRSSERIKNRFNDLAHQIQSKLNKNLNQEGDNTKGVRIKKHEKPTLDKPSERKNNKIENQKIDRDIDKIDFEQKDKNNFEKNQKENQEQKKNQNPLSLKDILSGQDKNKQESAWKHEEHHENLPTNESESDRGKDSKDYKNIVSNISDKMKSGIGDTKGKINSSIDNLFEKLQENTDKSENTRQKQSEFGVPVNRDSAVENEETRKFYEKSDKETNKNVSDKPFEHLRDKGIEAEKPFKAGKKMPEVNIDYENNENKENVQSENINNKKDKKKDVNVSHVSEKDSGEKNERNVSSPNRINQMIKQ